MNAKVVRDILNDSLGENQVLSFIPSSHYVFSEQEITIKQFHDILNGFENYFTDFIQSENADEITTQQLQNAIKKLNKGGILAIECSSKETLEGFDKIAKFGDTNLLYWKV